MSLTNTPVSALSRRELDVAFASEVLGMDVRAKRAYHADTAQNVLHADFYDEETERWKRLRYYSADVGLLPSVLEEVRRQGLYLQIAYSGTHFDYYCARCAEEAATCQLTEWHFGSCINEAVARAILCAVRRRGEG